MVSRKDRTVPRRLCDRLPISESLCDKQPISNQIGAVHGDLFFSYSTESLCQQIGDGDGVAERLQRFFIVSPIVLSDCGAWSVFEVLEVVCGLSMNLELEILLAVGMQGIDIRGGRRVFHQSSHSLAMLCALRPLARERALLRVAPVE